MSAETDDRDLNARIARMLEWLFTLPPGEYPGFTLSEPVGGFSVSSGAWTLIARARAIEWYPRPKDREASISPLWRWVVFPDEIPGIWTPQEGLATYSGNTELIRQLMPQLLEIVEQFIASRSKSELLALILQGQKEGNDE